MSSTDTEPADMTEYRLERLDHENADAWEEFNNASPEGSVFHGLEWMRLTEKYFRARNRYFLLYRDNDLIGLFPYVEHTTHRFRGLIAANYPITLHVLLKNPHDPLVLRFVIEELRKLYRTRKGIAFICPATLHPEMFVTSPGYPVFPYADDGDMVLDLSISPPERIWSSFTSDGGQRKLIRRFETDGFEITEVDTEADLQRFYQYYAENMNLKGAVLPPFSYFCELYRTMSDRARVTLLTRGPLVAGGVFNLLDTRRRKVYGLYLSLNKNLPNKYSPSYYLYWEGVNWAWEHHYEKFSLGLEYEKDLDARNPRYRIKRDFGGQFEPVISRMIPLTALFAMGVKYKTYQSERRAAGSRSQVPQ